jgi:hypothetical protein
MNQPETEKLKSLELSHNRPSTAESGNLELLRAQVEELFLERQSDLETIRPALCLKFYNEISDKLQVEKKRFEQLLNLQDKKREILSRYTFVLNPYYFEQKFFGQQ